MRSFKEYAIQENLFGVGDSAATPPKQPMNQPEEENAPGTPEEEMKDRQEKIDALKKSQDPDEQLLGMKASEVDQIKQRIMAKQKREDMQAVANGSI